MSRSSLARRERTPRPRGAILTESFAGYPYLVTRIGHSALRHVAVLPTTWSREQLVSLTRRQALANRLDTCLALGPEHAVYVSAQGTEEEATLVPTGLPVVEQLVLAEEPPATPELVARQAALRAWAYAQIHEGWVVGDGLEAGRPATREDRIALTRHEDDPHPGLTRCRTCGELTGDYLATHGEGDGDQRPRVIRVHCHCENHNRCARCGEPLDDRRLSAYYYDEERGSVYYVAAYCGLSHRCREVPADRTYRCATSPRLSAQRPAVRRSPPGHDPARLRPGRSRPVSPGSGSRDRAARPTQSQSTPRPDRRSPAP